VRCSHQTMVYSVVAPEMKAYSITGCKRFPCSWCADRYTIHGDVGLHNVHDGKLGRWRVEKRRSNSRTVRAPKCAGGGSGKASAE
jgi:hypothetical protein